MNLSYTVEENADGSAIIKLAEPVQFNGESLSRLTIPAITGRHMRRCPWNFGVRINVGEAVEFASTLVEPAGVVDVLPAMLARDIGGEVISLMGKSLQTGEPGSSGSGT